MTVYLLADGARVGAEKTDGELYAFRVTLPVAELSLISGHALPIDIIHTSDRRRLGVAVLGIRWKQGDQVFEPSVRSPGFVDGFHPLEVRDETEPFRWTNGNGRFPPNAVPSWHGEAILDLQLMSWAGTTVLAPPGPEVALLSAFENLGDNCELAYVQRHYGVQIPLTLLDWAGTDYDRLSRGLANRFDGLGDPETTEAIWEEGDYRLRTPYLNLHAFVEGPACEEEVAEVLVRGRATLRLLRRRMLRDLAAPKRIFVYKTEEPGFGQREMRDLHRALREFGPASLLCVTLKPADLRDAPVEQLADGLYAGYLERFAIPGGTYDEWLALCSRTLALHYAS